MLALQGFLCGYVLLGQWPSAFTGMCGLLVWSGAILVPVADVFLEHHSAAVSHQYYVGYCPNPVFWQHHKPDKANVGDAELGEL